MWVQAGILAIGRGQQAVRWQEGQAVVVTVMEITLSADSRVLGGDVGGELLGAVAANLSNPSRLLL